jgi:DNA-binding MurR/RpiR family transcriptional regulator
MEPLTTLLHKFDSVWQKRRRVLDTKTLLAAISDSAYGRHGIANSAEVLGVSASAVCRALQKLPRHAFKTIQQQLVDTTTPSSRVFALDGSKFYVPKSFTGYGFRCRTNNVPVSRCAKRPIAMLSTLVDVHSNIIHAFTVTKHFNERKAVEELIHRLKPGDTVICDRGYYSLPLYSLFTSHRINVLFRLKKDAFSAAKTFYASRKTLKTINIQTKMGQLLPMSLHKYFIDGQTYMVGYSPGLSNVQALYKLRWKVELCFRRLKSNLNLNYTYSLTHKLWEQHIEARMLIDTISVKTDMCTRKGNSPKSMCRNLMGLLLNFNYCMLPLSTYFTYKDLSHSLQQLDTQPPWEHVIIK